MTTRVALVSTVLATIACGARSPSPPTKTIEKPAPIATAMPDASPPPAPANPGAKPIARQPFKVAWRKAGAGEGGFAHSVAVRPDGAVAIAGDAHLAAWTKKRRAKLRPSIVAMLDATGALAWSREFGVGTIEAIASVPDGIVACGTLDKTGLVALALGADGKQRWRLDAKGLACDAIAVMADGKVALTGTFVGEHELGNLELHPLGDGDVFVALLDASGKLLWVATAGGTKPDTAHAIAVSNGAIYVTGWYEGTAKFQSHTVELARPAGAPKTANPSNIFLARFEPSGDVAWVSTLGIADSFDRGWTLAPTSDGVVVAGEFKGNAFLARYGADGKQRWLREAAGTGRAVLALPDDDILLATFEHGETGTTTLARYTGDGELIDRARLGGSTGSMYEAFGIARNAAGRIAIAGLLRGDSTISGELAASAQVVADKDSQGIVVDVLDP